MKKLIISIVFSILTFSVFATHNRAGEITYRQLSEFTYEVTVVTYTNTLSFADRKELTIQWGDGTSNSIQRYSIVSMVDNIQQNKYRGTHTFSGPGIYAIVMSDANRNANIVNIPNAVNIVFSLHTVLRIDALLGFNNTPTLLNPPVDKAALGIKFVHNPSAFDVDGDSLSYKLAICLGDNGLPIPGYTLPTASDSIYVNPITGDLVWDAPTITGAYNIAMEIEEWRNGIKIGSIIRDMQIRVTETNNKPPVINPIDDYCVTAGEFLQFNVTATDPDNDFLELTASGGPFQAQENQAIFDTITTQGTVTSTFMWNTNCSHVRRLPYSVIFRAADKNTDVSLSSYKESNITVNAPAPLNLQATATSNTVILNWDKYLCTNAVGYKIYRKNSSQAYTPAYCTTGLPASAGYQLITTTDSSNMKEYIDGSIGNGLIQGYEYCYRITAVFPDLAESYPSNEVCVELKRENPIFIETTVNSTNIQNGEIQLQWLPPTDFDETIFLPPYIYKLSASQGINSANFAEIAQMQGIQNTQFIHQNIDTKTTGYNYKLVLWATNSAGNAIQIGTPAYTTSVFVIPTSANRRIELNATHNTPWTNFQYIIYRKPADELCSPTNDAYDSIGISDTPIYTDYGLENSKYYWYKVKTVGKYDLNFLPAPLLNFSQETCISPNDTTPPCPLTLTVESNCEGLNNTLTWQFDACQNDAAKYLIYYSPTTDGTLELLETIISKDQMTFEHFPTESLAGCYVVSAVDSAGNYIKPENLERHCVDNCSYYELPNVFTPDADGVNDLFIPFPYKFVTKIDLQIFNRWGQLVFSTSDPDINWNGTDQATGNIVTDGTYYYVCDVYERRLTGIEPRNLSGFIQIIGNRKNGGK